MHTAVEHDEIGPDDSISNISTKGKSHFSVASKVSSTESARVRAKAEQAALIQRKTALEEKYALEAEEEHLRLQQVKLRRRKEELEINTELAAASAIQVIHIGEQSSGTF